MCTCRWPTPASASRRGTCSGCSSRSSGSTIRWPSRPTAPGSAWPSARSSSSSTGAGSGPRAGRTRARRSTSPCRSSRPRRKGRRMPISRRDAKKAKILYIEDNRENRMLVRAILEAEGYSIVDAEDGLAGIEAAIREEPSLILLDVNLPAVDGYEVVSIIKSFPAFATTPVIAVTAYAMEGDRQRTLVAGCDGYIQKPIDVDTFPRQVAEFLHGKREHVEEREQGVYLRELNQRLVYRLVNQVEELKRLNQHFVRRAAQLADLHRAVQDITSELGVAPMLERLLNALAQAIGTTSLRVDLSDPPGVSVVVAGATSDQPRSVLSGA